MSQARRGDELHAAGSTRYWSCGDDDIARRLGVAAMRPRHQLLKLEKNNLLNDQEFAEVWAEYRSGKRYGPGKIKQELRAKGITSEEAQGILDHIPEEKLLENAVSLARKSLRVSKKNEDPRKTRQRVTAMIVRRGFSWDLARQALDLVFQEENISDV